MLWMEKKWQLIVISYLMCMLCFNTDALVPYCDDGDKRCHCHPSYNKYNEKLQDHRNLTDSCLKLFTTKLDWLSAYKTCEREYSFIFQRDVNNSLYKTLEDQGIELIWIGMKRVAGFYVNLGSNEPSIFKESNKEWGKRWSLDEPVHECVALNPTSGLLETRDCSTELQFVCQNNGFPIYPVSGTLACPTHWLLFYQLPTTRKKCIQAFKSNSLVKANQTCLNADGVIADIQDYLSLYTYMSSLSSSDRNVSSSPKQFYFQFGAPNFWNKTLPGINPIKNDTESCVTNSLLSVLGSAVRENLNANCSDNIFICERDTRSISLSTRVTPPIFEAFPSTDYSKSLLTCEVLLEGRVYDMKSQLMKKQILFQWYKNGIPISVGSYLFHVGFYSDPTKSYPLVSNLQGTYRCGARVEGLQEMHLSPEVDYFYSDVSTYILTVHGDANKLKYKDFSQLGFRKYKADLKRSMSDFIGDLKTDFPNLLWDFQNFSLNENVSTIKMLLYIKRNETLYIELKNETEVERHLQKYITERKFISKAWIKSSVTLQSADVCFREVIPISETSYEGDLTWDNTLQTKMAICEPMCLNGWKLATRECKPSTVVGAEWQPFNYSLCLKYQIAVKDLKINCPDGFHKLKPNLCYSVNHEGHTFDEANEICRNSSSYLMNLRIFNTNMLYELEPSISYWISGKLASHNVQFSGMTVLPQKAFSNLSLSESPFHCASVTRTESFYNLSIENCKKETSFVCIHQPLKLLSSNKLPNTWSRLSGQSACYTLSKERVTWNKAKDICRSFAEESTLLQGIRHLDDYTLFKVFMHSFVADINKEFSWWINLVQDGDTLKWLSSPSQEAEFVDWNAHTDFSKQQSSGMIAFDASHDEIRWNLRDPSSKTRFICEIQDCTDTRPTLAYIENRTNRSITVNSYTAALADFRLLCIPSGWFITDSISWFKDGVPISSYSDSNELRFFVKSPASLEDILPFQGYYWCSVNQEKPFTEVHSSKILFRIPGLHIFVLYLRSQDLFTDVSDCMDYMKNIILPPEFFEHLNQTIDGFETVALRNLTCERSAIHYYIHIYVRENIEDEKTVLKHVESSVSSSIDIIKTLLEGLRIDIIYRSVRSTVACRKQIVLFQDYRSTWSYTLIGQSAYSEELCVGDKGKVIERECLGDFNTGAFWAPTQKECVDVPSITTVKLYELSRIKINQDNILNTSLNMEKLTSTSEDLNLSDIQYVAQILGNMATVPAIQPKVFNSIIGTLDHIIGVKHFEIDNRGYNSNVSSKISFALEKIMSNLDTNEQIFKAAGSNIAVSVLSLGSSTTLIPIGGILKSWNSNQTTLFNGTGEQSYSAFDTFEAGILLPENLVAKSMSGIGKDLKIAIHKNFHFDENIQVVSPVIDVSIGGRSVYDVDPPVEMKFKVPQMEKNTSYACVYWDQNLNNNFGRWAYKGCITKFLDSSHVHCFCDHLTSFAVMYLELRRGSKTPEVHKKTLSIITYLGCALSIFGLGIILLTFILFRQWRKELKHKALFHLSLALFSFLLIFVVGVERRRDSQLGCMAVAVLLHLFMLASFAWMLVEAFMQYLSLVKVIGTYIPRFMQKAVLFAWGVPVATVAIMLSIDYKIYNSDNEYCQLSGKAFFYAVAGPVLTMLSMNFVIFALILYSNTCGRPKKYMRSNQNERQETVTRAKAVFCVSILLGLSWIFGFLTVDETTLVFEYLFVVTTTLQGFFIFIFFVFRQKNTRDLWLRLFTPTTTPDISHISHNTGGTDDLTSRGANGQQSSRLSKAVFRVRMSYVSFKG